jgi:hypothetical protein
MLHMGIATFTIGMGATPSDRSVTARKQLLHDVSKSIDVTAGIHGLVTLDKFGRGTASCAAQHAVHIVAIVVGKAKIYEAHIVVRAGDEDIVGLEVIV